MAAESTKKKVLVSDEEKFELIKLWEGEELLYKGSFKRYVTTKGERVQGLMNRTHVFSRLCIIYAKIWTD